MSRSPLNTLLASAERIAARAIAVRRAMTWGAIVAALVLAFVAVDALVALPPAGRAAALFVLLASIGGGVLLVATAIGSGRGDPRRAARLLERAAGLRDSRLINALQLSDPAEADSGPGVSETLSRLAVDHGSVAAAHIDPAIVFDRASLRRPRRRLIAVLLVAAAAVLLVPRVFLAVIPRLLLPAADLPPYTPLHFQVAIAPAPAERVLVNKPVVISAVITGPLHVESASLVLTVADDKNGTSPPPRSVAMARTADGRFIHTLDAAPPDARFHIQTSRGRSATYDLNARPIPLFESLRVRITSPAYTRREPIERELTRTGLSVLAGSEVAFTIVSNVPLDRAEVHLTGGDGAGGITRLEPDRARVDGGTAEGGRAADLSAGRAVAGSWRPEHSGDFSIHLFSAGGVESDRAVTGQIEVLPDSPPVVRLVHPDPIVEAPEGWAVPIRAAITDDVAVDRARLTVRVNDRDAAMTELDLEHRGPADASTRHSLDLSALGAAAGDIVRGAITAWDNHPTPSNSAESPPLEIRVISRTDYEEKARQLYRIEHVIAELSALRRRAAQLDTDARRLAEQTADLAKRATSDGELTDADRAKAEDLRTRSSDLAEQLSRLAADVRRRAEREALHEFEQSLKRALADAAVALDRRAAMARTLAESLSKPTADSLTAAAVTADVAATAAALDRASADLDRLAAARVGEGGAARSGELSTRLDGVSLIGPHFPSGATPALPQLSASPIGSAAGTGPGSVARIGAGVDSEMLTVNEDSRVRSAVSDDAGVPPFYRDRAARYLRRIAEESR